jgi:16S rRNA (guanine527-N7)-methyltransferase
LASTPDVPVWFSELLNRELAERVDLSSEQTQQLFWHYEFLVRWNQRMNLTSVKPGREMVIRHYCESLFFTANLPAASEQISVLDLGSGAGFPGIPIAILKPKWRVTLVESRQKKAVFLKECGRRIQNVAVLAERIENVAVDADWVVARAVDPEEVLDNVPRLAANIGLMLTEDDFSLIPNSSNIAWRQPVRLPWGDRRICVYGFVSRET